MEDNDVASATLYICEDLENPDVTVTWEILKDGDDLEWATVPEASVDWVEDIQLLSHPSSLSKIFFSHFLP